MIRSFLSNTTYNYASKYFIEGNGAYNGSEKFGPDYRFQLFPSIAVGWMISEEKIMKNLEWLDKLKVRGSYGIVGDDNFSGRWKYITQWSSYDKALEMNKFGSDATRFSPYNLYKEASLGNPDLRWENSVKKNIGAELAVLKGQISMEFDYFTETRSDIMIPGWGRAIPTWFGISAPDANLGKVNLNGYEFVLNGNHSFGDLNLTSRFTFSHVVDKVVYKDDLLLKPDYQKAAGKPIGQTYAMIPGDIMKSWDDVYMATALSNGQESKRIGYYDIIDYNIDGDVNGSYDNVPYGYPNRPQNTWSFDIGGQYKGFGVSVQFFGQHNMSRNYNLADHVNNQKMYFKENANIWTPENPTGDRTYTACSLNKANNDPINQIYDGTMIRLKMVELSYMVPSKYCKSIGIKTLRVFANGNNLALWTDMPDDRDFSTDNYRGGYPTMRRINFGFNLNF